VLKRALLLFEHVTIRTIIGLVDLVRQLRDVSAQDLDEQGPFVVVEGQGVHIRFPIGVLEKTAAWLSAAATVTKPVLRR
jgi:hypothetical protein